MLSRLCCLLALVLVVVSGCGDGGAEVSKKQFALLGELRDTLAKVKDATTLKTELPKLTEIAKELAAAQAELNKQQVSTEQQRDLRLKYGKELESLQKDLIAETKRLDALPEVSETDRDQLIAALSTASVGSKP